MRKFCWLILLLGVVLASCNKEKAIIKQADKGNFRVLTDSSKAEFQVLMKPHSLKANKDKIYTWYQDQKIHQTKGGYSGKLMHGTFVEYYASGNLKEKGVYKRGLKNGVWRSFYPKGALKMNAKFSDGDTVGVVTLYDLEGKETVVWPKYMKKRHRRWCSTKAFFGFRSCKTKCNKKKCTKKCEGKKKEKKVMQSDSLNVK